MKQTDFYEITFLIMVLCVFFAYATRFEYHSLSGVSIVKVNRYTGQTWVLNAGQQCYGWQEIGGVKR